VRAERDLLARAYDAFNARDLTALAATLHDDVEWPDILEGGTLSGRPAVIAYFGRQLDLMIPDARIIRTRAEPPDRLLADIQYAVRGLQGGLWSDTAATLAYDFRDGLIVRMTVIEGL